MAEMKFVERLRLLSKEAEATKMVREKEKEKRYLLQKMFREGNIEAISHFLTAEIMEQAESSAREGKYNVKYSCRTLFARYEIMRPATIQESVAKKLHAHGFEVLSDCSHGIGQYLNDKWTSHCKDYSSVVCGLVIEVFWANAGKNG